jgi:hypothetical protein
LKVAHVANVLRRATQLAKVGKAGGPPGKHYYFNKGSNGRLGAGGQKHWKRADPRLIVK